MPWETITLPAMVDMEVRAMICLASLNRYCRGALTMLNGKEGVSVRITDIGVGCAVIDLPSICDEFRRMDGSASRRPAGLRLGLGIARMAAKMPGGDIRVRNPQEAGSVFTLTLPVVWQDLAPACRPFAGRQPSAATPARKTVHVVDGEPEMVCFKKPKPISILYLPQCCIKKMANGWQNAMGMEVAPHGSALHGINPW